MIKVAVDEKNRKIYVKECFYLNNLQISDLRKEVSLYARSHELIVADSADPRMISELRSTPLNIKGVEKKEGSVTEGIRLVQDYDIITDKKAGIPNKVFNHLLSGIRYYIQGTSHNKQSHQTWRL